LDTTVLWVPAHSLRNLCTFSCLCKNCPASWAFGADAGGIRGGGTQIREGGMQSMGYRGGGHVE
jgi:hypothetical protein